MYEGIGSEILHTKNYYITERTFDMNLRRFFTSFIIIYSWSELIMPRLSLTALSIWNHLKFALELLSTVYSITLSMKMSIVVEKVNPKGRFFFLQQGTEILLTSHYWIPLVFQTSVDCSLIRGQLPLARPEYNLHCSAWLPSLNVLKPFFVASNWIWSLDADRSQVWHDVRTRDCFSRTSRNR